MAERSGGDTRTRGPEEAAAQRFLQFVGTPSPSPIGDAFKAQNLKAQLVEGD